MKILMIAPTPFFADRGCHVRIFEEIKVLKGLGNDVTVYTYHLGKNLENINIKRIKNIKWYKKTSAGPSYKKIYLDYLLLTKILKEVKKKEYDIIHAHLHEGALIGSIVSHFKKIPLVFDYQGSLVKEMKDHGYLKNKLIEKIFKFVENKITKSSQYILTSSTKSKKALDEEGYTNAIPILDGVDTNEFNKRDVEELKKELGLENQKIVTYLGVLNKYQGIDLLINTIPSVIKEVKDAQFIIAGYPNVEHYKKLAEKLGVSKNITFTGRLDYKRAPEFISLGDIAISLKLSKTEANGKLYNYMACNVPTIATDNEINREILQETGIYCNPDEEEIAYQLVRLLKNKKLRETLGNAARKKAVDAHSWESRGKTLMEIYQRCQRSR